MSESDPVTVAVQQIRQVPEGMTLDNLHSELSVGQLNVLDALMSGKSIKDAAIEADVARMTIYRWISGDPVFKAAHNAWKQESRESANGRIADVVDDAVTNVAKAVAAGDTKLSYQLLKDLGFLTPQREAATDPTILRRQIELELRQQADVSEGQWGRGRRVRQKQLLQAIKDTLPELPQSI